MRLVLAALAALAPWTGAAGPAAPPDEFLFLEKGADPGVRKWETAQNARTRKALDARPGREAVRKRLEGLMKVGVLKEPVHEGGRIFFLKRDGLQNQPILYVKDLSNDEPTRVLLDPNPLSPDGTVSLDWWYPSHDGLLLAYGLSEKGSEDSVLHVREVDSGLDLPDIIPRTSQASVAWAVDRSGFFYTRHPKPGSVPAGEEDFHRRVYWHRMGSEPRKDELVFGEGRAKEDWPEVKTSQDGKYLLLTVYQGWSKSEVYLRDLTSDDSAFTPIAEGHQALYEGDILGDTLYLKTNEAAPRFRLIAVDPQRPDRSEWRTVVPEGAWTLEGFAAAGENLAVSVLERAVSRLRIVTTGGEVLGEVPVPRLGTIAGLDGDTRARDIVFTYASFFTPPSLYRYRVDISCLTVMDRVGAPADLSAFEARQVSYSSKDGTDVSMFLVHKKRLKRDKRNPVLLTGYGGFGLSQTPSFQPHVIAWLERGGVYALPNLRGGGEYGEAWHHDGMRDRKQNTFDDFLAAAEWLVREEYTSPARLAAYGASNGGLLVGAAITQKPALFRAAVMGVPLADMLRYHKFKLGALWVSEYGSPDDPEMFPRLRAYSPYHNVKPGVRYPATLILTGEADTRVDPMHARKMTAALQRDSASGHPVLLRLEPKAGHGAGKPLSKTIDELVDRYSFLFWQLGMERPVMGR